MQSHIIDTAVVDRPSTRHTSQRHWQSSSASEIERPLQPSSLPASHVRRSRLPSVAASRQELPLRTPIPAWKSEASRFLKPRLEPVYCNSGLPGQPDQFDYTQYEEESHSTVARQTPRGVFWPQQAGSS